jgi:uncharacterized protein YfiM (DUF2279 family)
MTYRCFFSFVLLFYCLIPGISSAQKDSVSTGKVNRQRLMLVAGTEAGLYLGSMAYLQYVWYKDHERVPFEFYNDSKGYLQVDKFGHAYGAYLESYAGYHALRWAGLSRNKALIYGGSLGFLLQLPIEVWDGMYEGWGFSWSDIGANAFGSALVVGQELIFREQVAKYKFSFAPSPYAKQANGYLGETFAGQLFNDYNGHTYWLSFGLNRIIPSDHIPDWLNIAVGYGANGMFGEFDNLKYYQGEPIPETRRYRQFLLSLDVDWTKIKTRNKFLQKVFQGMFMIKMPFPALEINTLGRVRGYGVYY